MKDRVAYGGGGGGISPHIVVISDAGSTVTLVKGATVISASETSAGHFEADVPDFGTWTIHSVLGGEDEVTSLLVNTVKIYTVDDSHFHSTINVTYTDGATCKCAKGDETFYANTNPYAFTVHSVGTWDIESTIDGLSIHKDIVITTDGQTVNTTLRFGTIILTYDDDFKGSPITCACGSDVIQKVAPTSGNQLIFYPNDIGTWTISGTVDGKEYSTDVEVVDLNVQVSALLMTIPEGNTATPTDDIQTWLKCANITDKSYTTLEEVLADTETYETLLADSNACDYMARSTTWAGAPGLIQEMTGYSSPSGTVTSSGEYDSSGLGWYAFDGWDKNSMSSWGANGLSNKWIQYKFDTAQTAKRAYIQTFDSGNGVRIKNFKILASNDNFSSDSNELYSGIFDQDTTEQFVTFENNTAYEYYRLYVIDAYPTSSAIINVITFQLYPDYGGISGNRDAMFLLGKYDYACNKLLRNSTWSVSLSNSRYFEYVLNTSVPTMTSATTPSGEVFASTDPWTNSNWFWLFNGNLTSGDSSASGSSTTDSWVAYDFVEDIIINKVSFMNETQTPIYIGDFIIESSDDNVTWNEEDSGTNINKTTSEWWHFVIENPSGAHRYWRFHNLTNGGGQQSNGWSLQELQFYGRKQLQNHYLPLVPTMTSNTTPSGEAICSSTSSSAYSNAYHAFDNNDSTYHIPAVNSNSSDYYLGYSFSSTSETKVEKVICKATSVSASYYFDIAVYAGSSTSNLVKVSDVKRLQSSGSNLQTIIFDITNPSPNWLYVLKIEDDNTGGKAHIQNTVALEVASLQFYNVLDKTIIHSAPFDTIYYMDNGSPVVVCTTNSDGVGEFDLDDLDEGTYTLYSSVAKDPDNLSNDYSKSIRVTKTLYGGTTELYLMPDAAKTMYWWGYMSSDAEIMSTANGWNNSTYGFITPTFNTYDFYASISNAANNWQSSGIGFKDSVTVNKMFIVGKCDGGEQLAQSLLLTRKAPLGAYSIGVARLTGGNVLNMAMREFVNSSTGYIAGAVGKGTTANINAVWYE